MLNKILNQKILIVVVVFVMFLCISGQMSNFYKNTFKKYYVESSLEYLDSSLEKSSQFFMTTSGAKAVVAVIEGSQLGVNLVGQLAIEAGDIVQPLYDIIHIMWKISLVSLTSLGVQKIAVTYFPLKLLDHLILFFIITWVPIYIHSNIITNFFYRVSKFILIISTTAYLLVPLGVYFSAKTSNYIYVNHRQPIEKELDVKIGKLSEIKEQTEKLYNIDSEEKSNNSFFKIPNPKKKFNNMLEETKSIIESIETLSEGILKLGATIITLYLMDVIFLPLIFMFLIYFFIKIVILEDIKVIEKTVISKGIFKEKKLKDNLDQKEL